MTNHEISNAAEDYGKVVLWQYDHAYHLLLLLKYLEELYNASIANFWSFWNNNVLSIENCSDFGVSVWGLFLGVPRPYITVEENGVTRSRAIDLPTYRKLLHGTFFLMHANGSFEDLVTHLSIVFTPDGIDRHCGISLTDNLDMSITYAPGEYYDEMTLDQKALFEQHKELIPYPLGIKSNEPVEEWVFGFHGQENSSIYRRGVAYTVGTVIGYIDENGKAFKYECTEEVTASENTGWESISHKFIKTMSGPSFVGSFSGEVADGKYKVGQAYQVGDVITHDNRVWICVSDISETFNKSWTIAESFFSTTWENTTFICDNSDNEVVGVIYFQDRQGHITKYYNGRQAVLVTEHDLGLDQEFHGNDPIVVTTVGEGKKAVKRVSISLDRAAAEEGMTVWGDATIGDIFRWLGNMTGGDGETLGKIMANGREVA